VESNSEIEKAFEKEILGETQATWVKEEIDGKGGKKDARARASRSLSKETKNK